MASKTKEKKGAVEKSGKRKQERGRSRETGDPQTERSKESYMIQVLDLESQLEKYKKKCDELEVKQKDFSYKYSSLENDKKDIVLYLKQTVIQKEDEVFDLSEQLSVLRKVKESEKASMEKQLAQLRQDFQEKKDQLTSENMVLVGKLASLDEFHMQKEELMERLTMQEEQLKKQSKEHQLAIHSLEKKNVLDNDRVKKEMHQHMAAIAAELKLVSERKIPVTTMRAIHENMSVTTQLSQLSHKIQVLLEENQTLKEKEEQLKSEMAVLKPLLQEKTIRSLSNQKVLHHLSSRCDEQLLELKEHVKRQTLHAQLQEEHSALQKDLSCLRQDFASLKEELEQTNSKANALRKDLEREKDIREYLEAVHQEAANALCQALKEVPKEKDTVAMILSRRNQLMKNLLVLLDNATLRGKGPILTQFLKERAPLHEHKTAEDCTVALECAYTARNGKLP
ncbi:hypothetical protein COCON_G00155730 [Conger conger]|uniref:Cilia- and flagella-associated protein 157 n=1 Tax=Conger conger TaxID=82655 RepID=A0A9Q1D957_CONCO|nr:cilia- and flagella-associated protein 157 [Conger conger]KAJ8263116.1 hypothetical protein COCON_G00155730 [Conger conger]